MLSTHTPIYNPTVGTGSDLIDKIIISNTVIQPEFVFVAALNLLSYFFHLKDTNPKSDLSRLYLSRT